MGRIRSNRLGTHPGERMENRSVANGACPDILSVEDAKDLNLAGPPGIRSGPVHFVIGTLISTEQFGAIELPEGTSVANYEGVVAIPDEILLNAAKDLLVQRHC